MLNKIYLLAGCGILALYSAVMYTGWEFGTEPREKLTENEQHGGYRNYYFAHGYRGGK